MAYYIGDRPHNIIASPESDTVQIPDNIRKCVAFAGFMDRRDEPVICGTVFFVGSGITHGHSAEYAVTARHVVDGIQRHDKNPNPNAMFFKINKRGGSADFHSVSMDQWRFHEDDNIDVAVMECSLPSAADHWYYPDYGFLTEEVIGRQGICEGSELFFVGLYSRHIPEKKNVPIVRVGNIAAMPDSECLIKTKNFKSIEAYLVEARSIGGLSGSPVFVYQDQPVWYGPTLDGDPAPVTRIYHLLGLIHGHHTANDSQFDFSEPDGIFGDKINTGIAIVTPISKVAEILRYPEFVNRRKDRREAIEQEAAAVPD